MMKKAFLLLSLCVVFSAPATAGSTASDQLDQFRNVFMPLVRDLSEDWDQRVLQKHLQPAYYTPNADAYKALFERHAHLGKAQKCSDLERTEINQLEFLVIKLNATCQFENGSARVNTLLKADNAQAEVMGITLQTL